VRASRRLSAGLLRGRWLSVVLVGALGVSCAPVQKPGIRPAELRTRVLPATATVQVDERYVGAARRLDKSPAKLAPGKHRVTVEAAGFFPHDVELELAPGVTTLDLKLRPIPR
jgi:hypothetical protein